MTNRIREFRVARSMTQAELGNEIGLKKWDVSRLEKEEIKLQFETAQKLADLFGVSIQQLVGLDDAPRLAEDATPYKPIGPRDPFSRLADDAHTALYNIHSDALSELGIHAGYVVLIDYSAEAVNNLKDLTLKPVIAQVYDPDELTVATTVIRQFVPPQMLITNSATENLPPIFMGNGAASIKGVIRSWHRALTA